LEQRKQQHKLEMYRNFSRVLVVSLAFCGVFAAYQMYFVNANMVEQPVEWKFVWIMDGGFWNMQYTYALSLTSCCSIQSSEVLVQCADYYCFPFCFCGDRRPTPNTTRWRRSCLERTMKTRRQTIKTV
jgi:hypothetical protein